MSAESTTSQTSPAKAEATGAEILFEYDGESYVIPPAQEWDLDVLESYEDGKIASTCRALLGVEQWATFKTKRRTVSSLEELFLALQNALGVEGN